MPYKSRASIRAWEKAYRAKRREVDIYDGPSSRLETSIIRRVHLRPKHYDIALLYAQFRAGRGMRPPALLVAKAVRALLDIGILEWDGETGKLVAPEPEEQADSVKE